ncbi:MAG TPA: HEAT repeat domain-containing protein, partial [Gemmataceae bacterium]|nr:HEAT repeat domain-containing protein [Gemmataceae bacterium]
AFLDPSGTGLKDFRPYTLRPTTDGRGFYVTDWGFSGWSQPVKAGRIWKVSYVKGDVKPAPRGEDGKTIEELIRALHHPAHSERLRVQRILEDEIRKYVAKKGLPKVPSVPEPWWHMSKTPAARKHLLWAWHNATGSAAVRIAALNDPDAGVRAQVARLFGSSSQPSLAALLLKDKSAEVRHQALLALARSERKLFFSPNMLPFEDTDVYVRSGLVGLLRAQKVWQQRPLRLTDQLTPAAFEAIVQAHAEVYEVEAVNNLIKGLDELDSLQRRALVVETLARAYKDRKPYAGGWWGTRPEQQKPPARVVAWEGTTLVRDAVLASLADKDAGVRKAAVAGLRAMNDPATLAPLVKQFAGESDPATRSDIVRAVGGLKAPKAVEFLDGVLQDAKNPEVLRVEAVAALTKMNTPPASQSIARAATAANSPALQVAALDALGALKSAAGRAAAEIGLKSAHATVRKAAAGALGKLGDAAAAPALLPLLADKDAAVRSTAIQALGMLKATVAIPALVKAAGESATQFDAVTALAKMPDLRALSAYLIGLGSKNADLRQASRQALATIRDQAAPALEELAKRNELPTAIVTELARVYRSCAPVLSWKLIGPFPNDGTAFPPEKELTFAATYKGAGADVKWRDHKTDARTKGKVDLLKLYNPNQNVVAYGYAELESQSDREAALLVGSDDSVVIWLNGTKAHEFPGDRGWKHDSDTVKVTLKKGKNLLLIKCGQHGGDWAFSVAVSGEAERYAFLKGGAKKFDLEAFRVYGRKNRGDAERGRRLFFDVKGLACVKCHAVGGEGGKVGPDMLGIGLRYQREDLITSILEPSKQIANGYETLILTTTDGKQLTGVFKGESGDAVRL